MNGHAEEKSLVNGQREEHKIDIDAHPQLRKSLRTTDIVVKFVDVKFKVAIKKDAPWYKPWQGAKHSEKELLHGITGSIMPGEVLALMGPSGSGKTTFLSLLGGRARGTVDGTVTYNDMPYSKGLKRKMGFVTQDDVFFPHLTVWETLMYAALLRLPRALTRKEKLARAAEIVEELGLEKCRDTIIGGPFLRGISGGERKRVSIGHEVLIDPSILFLDEPTSGLDSTTALRIVLLLKKIAEAGRTVITTIHQPSSRLFHSFDKLLLLAEGHSIYFGKAGEAMPYFEQMGFSPMFASNPADFLLDLANGTTEDVKLPGVIASKEGWEDMPAPAKATEVKEYIVARSKENLEPAVKSYVASLPDATDKQRASINEKRVWNSTWFEQFGILWVRGFKERRHEVWSWLRITQVLAISLIVGALWYNSNLNNAANVQDQIGYLFFTSIFWGFFPLITAIFTFPQERAMLMKERASDMYQLSAYYMSRTLADIPMEWALPIVYLCISYWMANLEPNAGKFFLILISIFLNISVAQGCGFFIGATVMDVKKATTLASVVLLTFMLTGGYYLQYTPPWIGWVKYIAFTYYSYRLTMKIQYDPGQTFPCGPADNPTSVYCPVQQELRGVDLGGGATEGWAMVLMLFGYRLLAYMALRLMKTSK